MAYCGPKGIPLHEFLAWPDESQQAALAWQAHEAHRCPGCGTHRDEWTEDGRPRQAHHFAEEICPGCQSLARARERLQGDANAPRGVGIVRHHGSAASCPVCRPTMP